MGTYLNPGSAVFRNSLNSKIYVDKSSLIGKTNEYLNTEQRYLCVSRPRRFGKSMAANMLAAYYDCSEDSSELFDELEISKSDSYRAHLNQYDVLKLNMQDFLSLTHSVDDMLNLMQNRIVAELRRKYSEYITDGHLVFAMQDIFSHTKRPFVILIDEWDCLFREYKEDQEAQKQYLDFLRAWLKDKEYVALAYLTGILPIKKYGSHSALNMFVEYSMTAPGEFAPYFGFTETEVKELCGKYQMSFEEARDWYDGYGLAVHTPSGIQKYSMYSPKSVVEAMLRHKFDTYWNQTETYEALKLYIQMNMDGLKDAVIEMIAGAEISIHTGTFSNDMTTFSTRDDVLTLLVHLGYLTYDSEQSTVAIPNKEVSQEYMNAIRTMDWREVIASIQESKKLLDALWSMDGHAVAEGIERAHKEISILQYHDENSLSCTIQLAFYYAREYYTFVRELPAGKGFADICFIPKKTYAEKPAILMELKWDKSAVGAISQIKEKQYCDALKEYHGNLLLAGINYDRGTKRHTCIIEKWNM